MSEFVASCYYCGGQWLVSAKNRPGQGEAHCPVCQPERDVEMPLRYRPATGLEMQHLDYSDYIQNMLIV